MSYIVAIDGPAATGKSTVAKVVAEKLGFIYVDTGAMYRALTLKAYKNNVDFTNEEAMSQLLHNSTIELTVDKKVFLDGIDVTDEVREPHVSGNVSYVAKHPLVREEMVRLQREMSQGKNVVMDGRDIGTVVFPGADLKVYMHASAEERGMRRHKENMERGIDVSLEDLVQEINNRDYEDMNREVGPLKRAEDALYLDTTTMTINEVVDFLIAKIKK